MMMRFSESIEFQSDIKKLKKFKSLEEDLSLFRKVISNSPLGISRHSVLLVERNNCFAIKSRLFCQYLRGNSLRIVYIYNKLEDSVTFLELFFKGDKPREDALRIRKYLR